MAFVKKIVFVEQPATRMFELVDRVEDYPLFLPWCGGTELIERSDSKTSARIHINYRGIKAHFATENHKIHPRTMHIALKEGPFRSMDGGWEFTPLGDGACKIEFHLNYEFSAKLLEKVLGPVFNHIANTFVDSFLKRAQQVN